MAITKEGIIIDPQMESLQDGEGIVVKLDTSYLENNSPERFLAAKKGREIGVFGRRLSGHEDSFGLAKQRLATSIDSFASDVNQFITDWNNGVYS